MLRKRVGSFQKVLIALCLYQSLADKTKYHSSNKVTLGVSYGLRWFLTKCQALFFYTYYGEFAYAGIIYFRNIVKYALVNTRM